MISQQQKEQDVKQEGHGLMTRCSNGNSTNKSDKEQSDHDDKMNNNLKLCPILRNIFVITL